MQEKATDKLLGGGSHQPLLTGSAIVPGSEGDLAIRQANQSMIGNGHPVGVAAKVMIGFLGAIKKLFGVDDPFFPFELPKEEVRHRSISRLAWCCSGLRPWFCRYSGPWWRKIWATSRAGLGMGQPPSQGGLDHIQRTHQFLDQPFGYVSVTQGGMVFLLVGSGFIEEATRIYLGRRGKRLEIFILKGLHLSEGLLKGNCVV